MSSARPILLEQHIPGEIRCSPKPACFLCGTRGQPLYENLRDRLYAAPGIWNLRRCPSPECGLIWLDPMPSEEDIGRLYRDYFTHSEVGQPRPSRLRRAKGVFRSGYWAYKYGYRRDSTPSWKRFLGKMIHLHPGIGAEFDFRVMYLPFEQGGRLLDVGCGNGQALQVMAELGWQVEGVDFDNKAVQIAQRKGLNVRLGKLECQEYPANSFDVITMSHVIEHVPDPLSLLKECLRILKPSGRLVVVTPNSSSWAHRRFGASWMHLDPPRHLHIFNGGALTKLVTMAGFSFTGLRTTIRDADGVFIGSRSIKRTGQHKMERSLHSRFGRLWARGMQLAEWGLLRSNVDFGEEIALIAVEEKSIRQ